MKSKYLIETALKFNDINQKQLALELGVSPSQITKWKKGDKISDHMIDKINLMLPDSECMPLVLINHPTGAENIRLWVSIFERLVEHYFVDNENGIQLGYYMEDNDVAKELLLAMSKGGVEIPILQPKEIAAVKYAEDNCLSDLLSAGWDEDYVISVDHFWVSLLGESSECTQAFNLACSLVDNTCDLLSYYRAYLEDFINELNSKSGSSMLEDIFAVDSDIIVPLAAIKTEGWKPEHSFKKSVTDKAKSFIRSAKKAAYSDRIPMPVDIDELINEPNPALGHKAEGFALGFSCYDNKHHIDYYESKKIEMLQSLFQVQYAQNKMLFELHPEAEGIFNKHLDEIMKQQDS